MDVFLGSMISAGVGLGVGYGSLGLSRWIRARQGKQPVDPLLGLNPHVLPAFLGLVMAIAFFFMQ